MPRAGQRVADPTVGTDPADRNYQRNESDSMNWIPTYTGKKFDLFLPMPDDVDILDIAHALANTCRFGGHTTRFYSVAQHSVLVSQVCQPWDAFVGLLHDAAEAYCGDVVRPLKKLLPEYAELEAGIQAAIFAAFGLTDVAAAQQRIKLWDDILLATEVRDLLRPADTTDREVKQWRSRLPSPMVDRIVAWRSVVAEMAFLVRFLELAPIRLTAEQTATIETAVERLRRITGRIDENNRLRRDLAAQAAAEGAQPPANGEESQESPELGERARDVARQIDQSRHDPAALTQLRQQTMTDFQTGRLTTTEAAVLHGLIDACRRPAAMT